MAQASIDGLHADLAVHVSARRPWMQAWCDAYPAWDPWVLGLQDGDGELRAVAALARRSHRGIVQIRCLGHTVLDRAPIVARDEDDARELANILIGHLRALRRPWTLYLRQLPADDEFLGAVLTGLRAFEVDDDLGRPIVRLRSGDPVSRNLRKSEARARNRIARDRLPCQVDWITDDRQLEQRLPEIRSVHRERDLQLRGSSTLDDPGEGAFYDGLFRNHLQWLELLEIRLDGQLAAYHAWIRNGSERLVFDNRVSPRWTAYSAGLIANNMALRAAASDAHVDVLDWGSGVQRYKLQSATEVLPHRRLYAWSSRGLRRVLGFRRARRGA